MTAEMSIQSLVDIGAIRLISSVDGVSEYSVDGLRHVKQTGLGRQTICYELIVDHGTESGRYEINESSDYQGGENLLCTDNAQDVVAWITGRLRTS